MIKAVWLSIQDAVFDKEVVWDKTERLKSRSRRIERKRGKRHEEDINDKNDHRNSYLWHYFLD